jgi:autotransporter-associated beta strand protein
MRINNNFGYANATIFLNDADNLDRADTANTVNDIGELGGTTLASIGPGNATGANTTWRVGFKNTTNTFAGSIFGDNNIVKVGTGKWILTGVNTYSGLTTVSNGVLALGDGSVDGSIGGSTNITVLSGASLDVSALIGTGGTFPLNFVQTLQGNGTVVGNLDNSSGGTVSPGLPTGTLNVSGSVTLGGSGTALFRLNRNAISTGGKLSAPSISLGGALLVTNIGALLQVGDTFDLLDGTLANSFSTVALPNYYTWNTNNLAVNGQISVTAILPGPTFSSIDASSIQSGFITLNAMNGAPGGTYILLTSTNVLLPALNWTPVATNSFDGSGNATGLVVPVNPAAPQQYYLLRAF